MALPLLHVHALQIGSDTGGSQPAEASKDLEPAHDSGAAAKLISDHEEDDDKHGATDKAKHGATGEKGKRGKAQSAAECPIWCREKAGGLLDNHYENWDHYECHWA